MANFLKWGGLAAFTAILVTAPVEFGPHGIESQTAMAVHLTPEKNDNPNNGHGNNIDPTTNEKVDDFSNPNWDKDSRTDGNSGLGDDKNGNNRGQSKTK